MRTDNPAHYRKNIKLGAEVDIVKKRDQKTGKRTRGIVQWILTSAEFHSRGIKVQLRNREVGRVIEILNNEVHSEVQSTDTPA
ncbi:MAG TPA: YwbE family protein [Bacteroidia bacterium]|nr:YwbE family protein [Bacteroidia bacterium]HRH08690.1 YwbE family protein [Bacteroidia bacterium]